MTRFAPLALALLAAPATVSAQAQDPAQMAGMLCEMMGTMAQAAVDAGVAGQPMEAGVGDAFLDGFLQAGGEGSGRMAEVFRATFDKAAALARLPAAERAPAGQALLAKFDGACRRDAL